MSVLSVSTTYFTCTNESLPAIIAGLSPSSADRILAIGGSGDQAFALLEHGAQVAVIDHDARQIDFIRHRAAALADGDYYEFAKRHAFFEEGTPGMLHVYERDAYFRDSERLRRMREHLSNLSVLPAGSIEDAVADSSDGAFTKMYLSNAVRYNPLAGQEKVARFFEDVARSLQQGGLVYIANSTLVCSSGHFTEEQKWGGALLNDCDCFLPLLCFEPVRSGAARLLQLADPAHSWLPAVYEKTG